MVNLFIKNTSWNVMNTREGQVEIFVPTVIYQYNQSKLIKNYHQLVQLFNKHKIMKLRPLNKEGLCNGLGKLFILYEKQGRSSEFKFFLAFVNSLDAESLRNLMDDCKKIKNPRLYLPHQRKDKNKPAFVEDECINPTFQKLISFLDSVNMAQVTQLKTNYKSIGANWEATNVIYCLKSEIDKYIKKSNLFKKETGHYKVLSNVKHTNAMSIDEGIKLYDPNGKDEPQTYHDEKLLTKILTSRIVKEDIALLFIDTLSYGNHNRELDDLLNKYKDIIHNHHHMQFISSRYKKGYLSRRDTAATLYHQLLLFKNEKGGAFAFRDELKNYLENNKNKYVLNVISDSFIKNDPKHANLCTALFYACRNGHFELVRELLILGADPYVQDEFGLTLIDMALSKGYEHIAQMIKQHQSVLAVINQGTNNYKKQYREIAQELSDLFDTYAHPSLFSLHWRSHRKLAGEIAKTLAQHSSWRVDECHRYIIFKTEQIEMNQMGTFKGILDHVKRRLNAGLNLENRPKAGFTNHSR